MLKNKCWLIKVDGPPEFFLSGVKSIPVIRQTATSSPSVKNFDDRRKDLSHYKLETITQSDFNKLLFSNTLFFFDIFNKQKILDLIDKAIDSSELLDLKVEVCFEQFNDGFLMVNKSFYNLNSDPYISDPYIFLDGLSSSCSVVGHYGYFDTVSVDVYNRLGQPYKKTLYEFEEKLYTEIFMNYPEIDKIVPLAITYDEFGIVYVNYYYNGQLIEHDILKNVKFDFDPKQNSFNYFTKNETIALKMFMQ